MNKYLSSKGINQLIFLEEKRRIWKGRVDGVNDSVQKLDDLAQWKERRKSERF